MFKNILVPTDASENAGRALKTALEFAQQFGSEITLLHITFTPEALGYSLSSGISVPQEDVTIHGEMVLVEALKGIEPGNVPIHKLQRPGHPAVAILEEIERGHHDLVIMGSRGYGPIVGPLLGSVSQRVLSKAKCPVLIVK